MTQPNKGERKLTDTGVKAVVGEPKSGLLEARGLHATGPCPHR